MAQVVVVFAKASAPGAWGHLPIIEPGGQSEELTSSGTSGATTITANAGDVARVTAANGNVWVKFGSAPTAVVADIHFVLSGQTLEFGPLGKDDKCAVIDDS